MEKEHKCPDCDTKLVYRMFDIDGTNLVEQLTCTECNEVFINDYFDSRCQNCGNHQTN